MTLPTLLTALDTNKVRMSQRARNRLDDDTVTSHRPMGKNGLGDHCFDLERRQGPPVYRLYVSPFRRTTAAGHTHRAYVERRPDPGVAR